MGLQRLRPAGERHHDPLAPARAGPGPGQCQGRVGRDLPQPRPPIGRDGVVVGMERRRASWATARPIERHQPVQVPGLTNVVAVSAGALHSVALRSDGTVWSWGWNGVGQLGDGSTVNRVLPVKVSGLAGITGRRRRRLPQRRRLLRRASVKAWGWNAVGQLGDGTLTDRSVPVTVAAGEDVEHSVAVSAGVYHSLALTDHATVFAWGWNGVGNDRRRHDDRPVHPRRGARAGRDRRHRRRRPAQPRRRRRGKGVGVGVERRRAGGRRHRQRAPQPRAVGGVFTAPGWSAPACTTRSSPDPPDSMQRQRRDLPIPAEITTLSLHQREWVGYSGTPLARKLGIKDGMRVALVGAPRDFGPELEPMPDGVKVVRQAGRRRRPGRAVRHQPGRPGQAFPAGRRPPCRRPVRCGWRGRRSRRAWPPTSPRTSCGRCACRWAGWT